MKKIPKKQFDDVVRLSREYWETGSTTLLQERIKVAIEIRDLTGIDWLAIIDFVDCIIRRTGVLPGASDEMLHILLRVLGWEVAENVEVNSAE
jgi:hypothetical protein